MAQIFPWRRFLACFTVFRQVVEQPPQTISLRTPEENMRVRLCGIILCKNVTMFALPGSFFGVQRWNVVPENGHLGCTLSDMPNHGPLLRGFWICEMGFFFWRSKCEPQQKITGCCTDFVLISIVHFSYGRDPHLNDLENNTKSLVYVFEPVAAARASQT